MRSVLLLCVVVVLAGCGEAPPPPVVASREISASVRIRPEKVELLPWTRLDLEQIAKFDSRTRDLDERLPAEVRDLSGQYVRIRGFMVLAYSAEKASYFVIARKKDCLFGYDAAWHFVEVQMRPGTSTPYEQGGPVEVEGWFRIDVLEEDVGDERQVAQLYHLDEAAVVKK